MNAVTGRVRLARNLSNIPFPIRMTRAQAEEVIDKVWEAVSSSSLKDSLRLIKNTEENALQLSALSEHHLVSPDFLTGSLPRAVILSSDNKISIMINEEDHIRIQVFSDTLSLAEAYDTADKLDTLLTEKLPIAYHKTFGFLTACPTNAGTGMRASYLLRLPALTISGSIDSVLSWAGKLGLTVRGVYGEGSKAKGAFYQLSNQITLGATERDIIARLDAAAKELIDKETLVRNNIYENNTVRLTDKCMRSFGILTNAYSLSSEEAFSLVSDVELGIDLGIIDNIDSKDMVNTLFDTLPASLAESDGVTEPIERDIVRARRMREKFSHR